MSHETKDWVVMTTGKRPLADIAKELRASGFHVEHMLDELHMITGQAIDGVAARVRKVKGVADVSANVGADIGPPDSDVS
ncbi:MAG TPA: hypothetical protein VFN10_22775 [Thermoanaerobaculia bacterium]|nr:hypothetical protein [Thermoanaerobaculia bacterium]